MSMTQHRVVLKKDEQRFSEREETIWFISPDEEGDLYEDLLLDWDVWTRMGKPNTITMTVQVGDTLNEPSVGGSPVDH